MFSFLDWTMLAFRFLRITTDDINLSSVISTVHRLAASGLNSSPFGVMYYSNGTLINNSAQGIARWDSNLKH